MNPLLSRRLITPPIATLVSEYAVNGFFGGITTSRSGESGYVSDGAGGWQNFAANNVIVEDGAVVCHPAYTRLDDRDDDLSGGAETLDLTSSGTGNYTLSVYGSAAVTVAAGTATGTGFGQATEGSPVTFNLSGAGTVTLTLDSGSLDTIGTKAAKQVQKNPYATPIAAAASVSATKPVVSWPTGLRNNYVLKMTMYPRAVPSNFTDPRLFETETFSTNGTILFYNSSNWKLRTYNSGNTNEVSLLGSTFADSVYESGTIVIRVVCRGGEAFFFMDGNKSNVDSTGVVGIAAKSNLMIGHGTTAAREYYAKFSDIEFFEVSPTISDAEILAL